MSEGIHVVPTDEAPPRTAPNRTIRELISASACGARGVTLRIVDLEPPERSGPRSPHTHPYEETIYVLEGRGEAWVDGNTHPIKAGDGLLIPAGHVHMLRNLGPGVMRLACFFPSAAIDADTVEHAGWRKDSRTEEER